MKTLKYLLQKRREKLIKPKRKVPPKWLFPYNAEKHYDRILYSLVKKTKDLIKEVLLPEIPSMIYEVEQKMPNDSKNDNHPDSRNDSYLDRLNSLMAYIKNELYGKTAQTILEMEAVAIEISKFNKNQFEKMNNSVFGIDIFVDEPWLLDQLKLFSSQNAQLINSLPEDELDRVSGAIERGLQQGLRFTEISKTIQKSFGISHRRAKLIARDQTTKLNASLTQLRQREVGVEEYIWQTSGDERVRPSHRANDGKTFRWDSPPKKTGHPGNDVNCRCVARPVLDKLLG